MDAQTVTFTDLTDCSCGPGPPCPCGREPSDLFTFREPAEAVPLPPVGARLNGWARRIAAGVIPFSGMKRAI
mgnify:CR=1 FL=1